MRDPVESIRQICRAADLPADRIKDASSILNKNLQHHDDSEEPLFKYFSNVVDIKHIDPEEYDRYREIYLTSVYEKNKTIEKLKSGVGQDGTRSEGFSLSARSFESSQFTLGKYDITGATQ